MDGMIRRAIQFYAQSPTGQYDDLAELALRFVGATMAGEAEDAAAILRQFEAMCNDD
jgi:hypothetical protein